MPTALDVANYFLAIAACEDDDGQAGEGLTQLKLQKLLYYAQGFHIAIFGTRLFPDAMQAWEHGPVVQSIWDKFKQHGSSPIPMLEPVSTDELSDEQREMLNDVWNTYGQFSAWKLRNMTHDEPPWKDAYRPGKNVEITDKSLKRYFEGQIVEEAP